MSRKNRKSANERSNLKFIQLLETIKQGVLDGTEQKMPVAGSTILWCNNRIADAKETLETLKTDFESKVQLHYTCETCGRQKSFYVSRQDADIAEPEVKCPDCRCEMTPVEGWKTV